MYICLRLDVNLSSVLIGESVAECLLKYLIELGSLIELARRVKGFSSIIGG